MSPKAKRLSIIAAIAALVGIAAMLVLGALRDNIVFFYTPTEITTSGTKAGQALRLANWLWQLASKGLSPSGFQAPFQI